MGLFGKKNNCKFKDMCNIAGADGTCRFCATENYQDCDLYQDWSGGGINENNQSGRTHQNAFASKSFDR